MPRIPRMLITGEPTVYHVMSRTALDGLPLGDTEKDFLLNLMKTKSRVFFTEIIGFCCMGNHFHLLVRMFPGNRFSDDEIRSRFHICYGKDKVFVEKYIPDLRKKWGSLSEFMKEVKQEFSRYYNKKYGRRGYFWGDRFKSLIVENGNTLIHCLAYIDLNPVRAGIVNRPEDYRWSSIGYHIQTNNKDGFLSLNLGLTGFDIKDGRQRLKRYRRYLYETGAIDRDNAACIDRDILEQERHREFDLSRSKRFMYRTRYFSDSGIIGSKEFVSKHYQKFKDYFQSKKEKHPKPISGLDGIYSLKRLTE